MSVNISPSQDSMIQQITSLVFRGFPDSALRVLEKSDLTKKQKERIETILNQPHGDYTLETTQAMNQSIISVIRGEEVQSAASSEQPSSSQTDVQASSNELPPDIMEVIFSACVSQCDLKTITAFHCTNKYWCQYTVNFFEACDLKHICPELTIMDAKAQERECDDEPKIDKFRIFKAVKKVAPHVDDNAGVTLLTMIKEDTLNKLIAIAAQDGIQIVVAWDDIIEKFGDVPIEQTYTILITNNVFIDSRSKNYKSQEVIVEGHGCVMPIIQEYAKLCAFSQKIFQKCLYQDDFPLKEKPVTYGRSSMQRRKLPLVVGGSEPGRFYISDSHFDDVTHGAGGRWKF